MKKTLAGLIVAGGKGKRMHSTIPKQFIPLDGIPMLIHALLPFEQNPRINTIVIVLPKKYHMKGKHLLKKYNIQKISAISSAGKTRQCSVQHGLSTLVNLKPDLVVVHDAARPLVTRELIDRVCAQAERSGAASAAVELTDTIIRKHNGKLVERDELLRIQTPQAFDYSLLCSAHSHAQKKGIDNYPDDTSLMRAYGVKTAFVEGDVSNLKLTSKGDLVSAEAIIKNR
jgi:2-C-methyl-D-erythritol 4-phosphate cytidylyltransferase